MGHDISGCNKAGKEISYIRFTAWDSTSYLFYELFDASDYHAGVSGSGNSLTFSLLQIKDALKGYHQLTDNDFKGLDQDQEFITWKRKEMLYFIKNCLKAAKKEGKVEVFFG